MDIWQCKDCEHLDPCVLLMPSDHELTATVCPYAGTDCKWKHLEDVDSEEAKTEIC